MTVTTTALSTGCRLVTTDGRVLPLRSVDVRADAGGGLARVQLRQTFANPHAEPLAVTYLLPLPADGAVVDFAFVLGGRRITGRVERRTDARAAFEQAVLEGRTAALLEHDRSSLFTQELGNLPPGAELQVEIDVEQPLAWVDGGWEWRWPTVVGPRYLGDQTADAEKITVDVADRPVAVRCTASLTIADPMTGAPSSPSHALEAGTTTLIGALDRDVVVRWPVAAPSPGVRLEVARSGDDAYGLLTLVPPATPTTPVARDLCLLLDTSGSMGGTPLAQLQAFSSALVQGLRDGDRLELIEFSVSARRWRPNAVRIEPATRADALQWIGALRAGGGTQMDDAVTEALKPLRPEAERQVVLVTDGYIGFEQEVIGRVLRALPRGSRIHTVGIGSSVNRTLTAGVARAGGGHEAIVGPNEAVTSAVAALLARTGDPLWVDVTVSGTAVRQVVPGTLPDLLAGAPARVSVKLDPAGGTLVVSARTASGPMIQELNVAPSSIGSGRRVLATRFAREAVEDLELALAGGDEASTVDRAIEALGLAHRIGTRLTSWIAATDEATVDPGDPTRRERMPHVLPHGVSAEGVGLRAPAPFRGAFTGVRQMMAAPAGAPMPPPPTGRAESTSARTRMVSGDAKKKEAVDLPRAPREAPAPMDTEGMRARRVPLLVARIVSLTDGRLTVEVDGPIHEWDPSSPVVVEAGGQFVRIPAVVGTTRKGPIAAGQVARLVLGWTGPAPVRIELGYLHLVFA